MARIRPKNWAEFQHYRDRNPSWIKLHKKLLDDFEFQGLPLASRALAPMLWLLASEDKDGWLDYDQQKISFRLRVTQKDLAAAIKPLIDGGFFDLERDASAALAETERAAIPEKEKQVQTEKENNNSLALARFDDFWVVCPRKVGKGAARRAYRLALSKTSHETLVEAMKRYAKSRVGQPEQYTVHPATWLNEERWADEATGPPSGTNIVQLSDAVKAEERENLRKLGLV